MASFRKRGRIWYYRITDADGIKVERKGCPDRRETEGMAREAENQAAKERVGLTDPKAEARRQHAARPLSEHLASWHANLLAEGNTSKHANMSLERARRVVALVLGKSLDEITSPPRTKFAVRRKVAEHLANLMSSARLADLTRDNVQAALATLIDAGLSLATANHHRTAIHAFTRWARESGRIADDSLVGLKGYNVAEDRRHDRRTISLEELRTLIEATTSGPMYQQMTGHARALCYRLAVASGLRLSEIRSLTRECLDANPERPTITVAACYTKNRKPMTLPLAADVATDLAAYVATMSAGSPIFRLPEKGATMLRADLEAAGIAYRDAGGLVFDFHALRCECATLADQAGVSPRVVQKLMRHSTLELTGRYTRPRMHDIEGAAASLPSLRPDDATEVRSLPATGTDGQRIKNPLAHYLPTGGDGTVRIGADAGGITQLSLESSMKPESPELSASDGEKRVLSPYVATSGVRTRTGDLRIMRPPL
jgi:integrase